jgi:hypothetical protein
VLADCLRSLSVRHAAAHPDAETEIVLLHSDDAVFFESPLEENARVSPDFPILGSDLLKTLIVSPICSRICPGAR